MHVWECLYKWCRATYLHCVSTKVKHTRNDLILFYKNVETASFVCILKSMNPFLIRTFVCRSVSHALSQAENYLPHSTYIQMMKGKKKSDQGSLACPQQHLKDAIYWKKSVFKCKHYNGKIVCLKSVTVFAYSTKIS